jgi:hypothetical protein
VASFLTEYRKVAFADPLYECVSAITSIPVEQLKDRAVKEQTIRWLGRSPRQMLQTLGTEWGRDVVHDELWVRALFNRIASDLGRRANVVITDVRFENEAAPILEYGGEVWRVIRPGASCLSGETSSHPSEAGIPDSMVSRVILNDGTLDDLKRKVQEAIIRR